MTTEHDRRIAISALRSAIPYLRLFQQRIFVIKAGGEAIDNPESLRRLVEQIGVLHQVGIKIVFVHGGGPQLDRAARAEGLEPQMIGGRRVTCDRTIELAARVLAGQIGTEITAACRAASVPAVALSGLDGGMIVATRRAPRDVEVDGKITQVDYGHVGDIARVDVSLLLRMLDGGWLPVVAPLSADARGQVLNINADVVAAALAGALPAAKLVLMTGIAGIRARIEDPASLVSYTDIAGLERLEASGAISGGMLPKVTSIKKALGAGVPRVHVISYKEVDSLLLEIFTNEGSGTMIVRDMRELAAEEIAKL